MRIRKIFSKLAELGEEILSLLPSHHRSNPYYGVYRTVTQIWRTFLKFAKIRGKMGDSRRQTRSTRRREQQTDAQFWSNQPDPLMIERGQADAIRLVRSSVNPAPETTTASGPMEANATNASGVPQMVFIDDEDLEEQFLTDEETANALNTSANRVTTPVNTTSTNQSIQQMQHEELDLQPSRGPREESIVNTIDQFLDENYEDVLRTSNI